MVRSACKGFPVRFVDAEENRGLFRLGGSSVCVPHEQSFYAHQKKDSLAKESFYIVEKMM